MLSRDAWSGATATDKVTGSLIVCPASRSPNETLPSGHGRHPSATSRDPSQAHWLGRLPEIRGFVGRCGGQWRCHGKSPAAQASPVPRCVIAVVDQLAARGALRRRILVVVALVSESGVVEALRIRRGFPDAGKKGIPRLGLQYRPQPPSVDGCGSGSEFAQDCFDGDGAGHSVPAPRAGGSCGDELFGAGGAGRADRDDVAKHDGALWVLLTVQQHERAGCRAHQARRRLTVAAPIAVATMPKATER